VDLYEKLEGATQVVAPGARKRIQDEIALIERELDTNGDGVVSPAEARAGAPGGGLLPAAPGAAVKPKVSGGFLGAVNPVK
jgi:hypothetical protein